MSCPCSTTNNGASRLSMINAAITIIYSPKTMFHAVHPCSLAALSFDSRPLSLFLSCALSLSLSPASLNQPSVLSPRSFLRRIYAKNSKTCLRGVSLRRLINRAGRVGAAAIGKVEGFNGCEEGGGFRESRETDIPLSTPRS